MWCLAGQWVRAELVGCQEHGRVWWRPTGGFVAIMGAGGDSRARTEGTKPSCPWERGCADIGSGAVLRLTTWGP